MRLSYTGVGSRTTPVAAQAAMVACARLFAELGYVLRSGHADGADAAFERGCDEVRGSKEIFLPWRGFNGPSDSKLFEIPREAFAIASEIHPSWERLSDAARKLHARNVLQVLGSSLDDPSKLLICWTPNGARVGGTRTAIVLAESFHVPIFNLALEIDKARLRDFTRQL